MFVLLGEAALGGFLAANGFLEEVFGEASAMGRSLVAGVVDGLQPGLRSASVHPSAASPARAIRRCCRAFRNIGMWGRRARGGIVKAEKKPE